MPDKLHQVLSTPTPTPKLGTASVRPISQTGQAYSRQRLVRESILCHGGAADSDLVHRQQLPQPHG